MTTTASCCLLPSSLAAHRAHFASHAHRHQNRHAHPEHHPQRVGAISALHSRLRRPRSTPLSAPDVQPKSSIASLKPVSDALCSPASSPRPRLPAWFLELNVIDVHSIPRRWQLHLHRSSACGEWFPPRTCGIVGLVCSRVVASCRDLDSRGPVPRGSQGGREGRKDSARGLRQSTPCRQHHAEGDHCLLFIPPSSPTSSARLLCTLTTRWPGLAIALRTPVSGVGFRDGVRRKSISCRSRRGAARKRRSRTRRDRIPPYNRLRPCGQLLWLGIRFRRRFCFSDTMLRVLLFFLMSPSMYGFIPPSDSTDTPHTHVPTYPGIQSSTLSSARASCYLLATYPSLGTRCCHPRCVDVFGGAATAGPCPHVFRPLQFWGRRMHVPKYCGGAPISLHSFVSLRMTIRMIPLFFFIFISSLDFRCHADSIRIHSTRPPQCLPPGLVLLWKR
ncbi:hypothetical protein C8F04DRAFT_612159 [Mycena alexandri]|uniref:Uncharacterized protein n=1 Tax=Mycena alexandri TaxID=1745969 RepID=A0AAD6SVT5_9AGAR|nr:hypothetical protein C8F04DRAFT_612159 [Mycena alexandri]